MTIETYVGIPHQMKIDLPELDNHLAVLRKVIGREAKTFSVFEVTIDGPNTKPETYRIIASDSLGYTNGALYAGTIDVQRLRTALDDSPDGEDIRLELVENHRDWLTRK